MHTRILALVTVLAVLAVAAVAATAQAASWTTGAALRGPGLGAGPNPMLGVGEGMELVANVPMVGDELSPAASDIELAGDYAYVGSYGEGMVVVDIRDPEHPVRAGVFDCPGGQNDIQLSPDARYAVMAIDTTGNDCHPGKEGSVVIDIADPAHPRELAFIPIAVGSHNNTLDWPYLYVDNYPTSYHKLEVFSLADPAAPVKVSELDFGAGTDGVHDAYVDHRPDGRALLYAASIGHTDAIDVTDPAHPRLDLRFADPDVSISHQAEPNFDRSLLLVTDEFMGGLNGTPACGRTPVSPGKPPVAVPQPEGSGTLDPANIGALHFYGLNADGSVKSGGPDGKVGTFNIPTAPPEPNRGCTVHVFWQAPAENRLVAAWYGRGVHVVDYADPANATDVGWFQPVFGDVWAAKPHRGYIFTGDINRGMDVLRYTGEEGKRWPATAGDAAAQRRGAPAPAATAAAPPAARRTGVERFGLRVAVPAGARTVTMDVRDATGALVSRLPMPARPGAVQTLRGSAGGLAGAYTYTLRAGERVLRRGTLEVTGSAASRVGLAPGQVLVCRLR
jgi:hypothetical protein